MPHSLNREAPEDGSLNAAQWASTPGSPGMPNPSQKCPPAFPGTTQKHSCDSQTRLVQERHGTVFGQNCWANIAASVNPAGAALVWTSGRVLSHQCCMRRAGTSSLLQPTGTSWTAPLEASERHFWLPPKTERVFQGPLSHPFKVL